MGQTKILLEKMTDRNSNPYRSEEKHECHTFKTGCCVKSQVMSYSSPEQGMGSWTDVTAPIRSHGPATPLYGEVWKQIKTIGTWPQNHHWMGSREGCCQERVGHDKHNPWQKMKFRLPGERSILCSLRSLQNLCQGCVTGSQHCFVARTWIKPPGRVSGGKVEIHIKHLHPFKGHCQSFLAGRGLDNCPFIPRETRNAKVFLLCVCVVFFLFISIKNKGLRRVHTHHTHAMI